MDEQRKAIIHERVILADANRRLARNASNIFQGIVQSMLRHSEDLDGCGWADKYRVMPATSRYRRWRTAHTPYLREIGERLSSNDPAYQFVILSKCAQSGGSELGLNEVLRRIHQEPCSILYYMEAEYKVRNWWRERLDPALKREPFQATTFNKHGLTVSFPGGQIVMNGIGSSTSLSSQSAMFVVGDEGSKYPPSIDGEGDFLSLAKQRGSTYGSLFKFYMPSTFRDNARGEGTFVTYWEQGDMREYVCPCAECGEFYLWRLDNETPEIPKGSEIEGGLMRIVEGKPVMVCPHCGGMTHDGAQRTNAVRNGKWVATNPEPDSGFTSYRISGFIVPTDWRPWSKIWEAYRNALDGKQSLQSFYNLELGLPFNEPEARVPDAGTVEKFCKTPPYPEGKLPDKVAILTMGIDVQKGYLDYEVRGWAEDMESWGIVRDRIPYPIDEVQLCMRGIRAVMTRKFEAIDGSGEFLTVALCMIDRGGFAGSGSAVDKMVRAGRQPTTWKGGFAFIPHGSMTSYHGASQVNNQYLLMGEPGGKTSKGKARRLTFWRLGTDVAKRELYNALNKRDSNEAIYGRPHTPEDYPATYFAELVAEQLVTQRNPRTGKMEQRFVVPPRVANEAIDLYVMNRACAEILRLPEFRDDDWARLRLVRERSVKDKTTIDRGKRRKEVRAKAAKVRQRVRERRNRNRGE